MSLEIAMMGRIQLGRLSDGGPLWDAFPGGLSFRFWVPLNRGPPHPLCYFLVFLTLELSLSRSCNFVVVALVVGRSPPFSPPFLSLFQANFLLPESTHL